MDFSFNEEQTLIQDTARRFAREVIAPTVEADEKAHRFNMDIYRQMGELGLFGLVIPEEYGGSASGMVSSLLATMEIARVSASWGLPFNMQTQGPGLTILRWGTDEQKKKYLPGLVSADLLGAFALTEPNAGSDVAGMKTYAEEDGDHWILNGQKTWISNAQVADVCLVFAYTDRAQKTKGMTCFLVDMKTTGGVVARPIEDKLGLHGSPTGEIFFEDSRIHKDQILGGIGNGFKVGMTMLDNTRLSCAIRAVGVGQACIDASVEYAKERKAFGRPIADFQMIQSDLAEMKVEHEAAKLLVLRAGWQKDQDPHVRNTVDVSIGKYLAAEAAVHAANMTVKIFGSYGYSAEYPAERLYRDAKSYQIVEGTSNIQKIIISRSLLG